MAKRKPSVWGTDWKGGSFKAAVGGYLRKKAKKAGKAAAKKGRRSLRKNIRKLIGW